VPSSYGVVVFGACPKHRHSDLTIDHSFSSWYPGLLNGFKRIARLCGCAGPFCPFDFRTVNFVFGNNLEVDFVS